MSPLPPGSAATGISIDSSVPPAMEFTSTVLGGHQHLFRDADVSQVEDGGQDDDAHDQVEEDDDRMGNLVPRAFDRARKPSGKRPRLDLPLPPTHPWFAFLTFVARCSSPARYTLARRAAALRSNRSSPPIPRQRG